MSVTVKIHVFLVRAELQSNTNYILRFFFGVERGMMLIIVILKC